MFTLKIVVKRNEVKTNLFGNDVNRSTAGQGGIHVHHAGIETIAGVCSYIVFRLQVVIPLIPMTEADEVTMSQLTALGYTR